MKKPKHTGGWAQAARNLIAAFEADAHNGRQARDPWQRAAVSMAKGWYIRSWQMTGKARRTPRPPSTWPEAIVGMLRELDGRIRRRQRTDPWERWAAQRPSIKGRCDHE